MSMYILEIYEPDNMEVLDTFQSNIPFLAIAKWDLINQSTLCEWKYGWDSEILVITALEHILWSGKDSDSTSHKICVYTTRVENTEALRGIE